MMWIALIAFLAGALIGYAARHTTPAVEVEQEVTVPPAFDLATLHWEERERQYFADYPRR